MIPPESQDMPARLTSVSTLAVISVSESGQDSNPGHSSVVSTNRVAKYSEYSVEEQGRPPVICGAMNAVYVPGSKQAVAIAGHVASSLLAKIARSSPHWLFMSNTVGATLLYTLRVTIDRSVSSNEYQSVSRIFVSPSR